MPSPVSDHLLQLGCLPTFISSESTVLLIGHCLTPVPDSSRHSLGTQGLHQQGRQAGSLTVDLHLSLKFSKLNSLVSPHLCSDEFRAPGPDPCPHLQLITQIFSSNLQPSCHPSHQIVQVFRVSPLAKPAREETHQLSRPVSFTDFHFPSSPSKPMPQSYPQLGSSLPVVASSHSLPPQFPGN